MQVLPGSHNGRFSSQAFSSLLPSFNCAIPLLLSQYSKKLVVGQWTHNFIHAESQALRCSLCFSRVSPSCMLPLHHIFSFSMLLRILMPFESARQNDRCVLLIFETVYTFLKNMDPMSLISKWKDSNNRKVRRVVSFSLPVSYLDKKY